MTVDEVAAYLRLPTSTVYRFAQMKLLPGFKVGKHWRFKKGSLEEWIDHQERDGFLPDGSRPPPGP